MQRCQQQADNQCQKSDSELFILTVLDTAGTDYILRLQYSMLHLAHRPLMGQQQTRALTACVQLQSEPQLCFTRPNDGRARHHRQAMSRNVPDTTSSLIPGSESASSQVWHDKTARCKLANLGSSLVTSLSGSKCRHACMYAFQALQHGLDAMLTRLSRKLPGPYGW